VPIERWLLQRVAHAVEAGEVSANLLTELQVGIAEAGERPPDERHSVAVQELADRFGLRMDQLKELLAGLEAQPHVTRELLSRRAKTVLFQDIPPEVLRKYSLDFPTRPYFRDLIILY